MNDIGGVNVVQKSSMNQITTWVRMNVVGGVDVGQKSSMDYIMVDCLVGKVEVNKVSFQNPGCWKMVVIGKQSTWYTIKKNHYQTIIDIVWKEFWA